VKVTRGKKIIQNFYFIPVKVAMRKKIANIFFVLVVFSKSQVEKTIFKKEFSHCRLL